MEFIKKKCNASIFVFVCFSYLLIPAHCSVDNVITQTNDKQDVLHLEFLTQLQTGDLHRQPYHIVNFSLGDRKPYTMHLKESEFFSAAYEHLDDQEFEKLRCVYSGSIVSADGKLAGIASLSSCHYGNAFEGFVFVENKHFYISPQPETQYNNRVRRSANKNRFFAKDGLSRQVQKYTIKNPVGTSTSKQTRKRKSDMLQIPQKTLEEARKQMMKDQDSLQDEDDDEDSENDTISKQAQSFSSEDENSQQLNQVIEALAVRRRPINPNKKRKKKKRAKAKVVELAVFTDESFYRKWRDKHRSNTTFHINQYLLTLVNNMNYMYHQPMLSPKISFRLVEVVILKDNPSDLDSSKNSEKYLTSFCKFQGKRDKDGKLWDHAMLITGIDIRDAERDSGTIGLAYTSSMCLRYYSCSLIEYRKGFETGFTATHEIGHSLGMDHDGESLNKNCAPEKFIMAAIADQGQINWSKCSVSNLKNFIGSGDPRPGVKDSNFIPRCLTKRGLKRNQINYRNGTPGKRFSVESQCETVCKGCTPMVSNVSPYNKICYMLYCRRKRGEIIEAHPALEQSTCGKQKVCRNGKCQ